jgi:hypothetical protein
MRLLLILISSLAITACGGGEPDTQLQGATVQGDTPITGCTLYRAAWVATPDGDIPLTGYEHRGMTDSELQETGVIHARLAGIDPAAVQVSLYAQCEE